MSRKEVPRAGLVKMVLAGKATNAQGAAALGVSPRHVQRLKVRFQVEGAPGLLHRGRGRPSTHRLASGEGGVCLLSEKPGGVGGTRSARSPPREATGCQSYPPNGARAERPPTLRKLHPAATSLIWASLIRTLGTHCCGTLWSRPSTVQESP
jgi:hypothetical protein